MVSESSNVGRENQSGNSSGWMTEMGLGRYWVFNEYDGGFRIRDKHGQVLAFLDPERAQIEIYCRVYCEAYQKGLIDDDEFFDMATEQFETDILPEWDNFEYISWGEGTLTSVPNETGESRVLEVTGSGQLPDFKEFFSLLRKLESVDSYSIIAV